jgi:hypothetical protein
MVRKKSKENDEIRKNLEKNILNILDANYAQTKNGHKIFQPVDALSQIIIWCHEKLDELGYMGGI